ncbi:MAG: DUF1735 domain-containing protein [Sphingobacteriales bacterium]|nr:MAG: DUF1735 domain-containing protein [Sphingobacteriales bacterium]
MADATPQVIRTVQIGVSANNAPATPITYTAVASPTLIPAGTTLLPASAYTFPATGTIPAGAYSAPFEITITNASLLNSNLTYGLAFTLTSASDGYTIAENAKVITMKINIKNKYDGVYNVTGTFTDFVMPGVFTGNYPLTYRLVTTGPSSVDVQMLINSVWQPGYLFLNAGAGTFFGSYGLTMTFNPTSDVISDLHNYYGDRTKALTSVGDPSLGTGAPNYVASNTRSARLDPTGVNAYFPATKTIRIKHFMIQTNQPTGPNPRSAFDETWTYTGPRP